MRKVVLVALVAVIVGALFLATRKGGSGSSEDQAGTQQAGPRASTTANPVASAPVPAGERVPPFHTDAEAAKPFPKLIPASNFSSYPVVAKAYRIAARIPEVLAQQPCYCWCDKVGHGSLLDCFASDHGAG